MRLIVVQSFIDGDGICFEEFYERNVPPYAILSHRWEASQEVSYQDSNSPSASSKNGYYKIQKTCELAAQDGLGYA